MKLLKIAAVFLTVGVAVVSEAQTVNKTNVKTTEKAPLNML